MIATLNLQHAICALFEVHPDEKGVQRVVTPLEYTGSGDQIIVRVRPRAGGMQIDENGDAAFLAELNGGTLDTDAIGRWKEGLERFSPAKVTDDDMILAFANDERLIAPYVLRVAEVAQQLYTLATSRLERQPSDFKKIVSTIVKELALTLGIRWQHDVPLPILGGIEADHVLGLDSNPIIIVAASSQARLLEAEIIHLQYRHEQKKGFVLAIAESQAAVTKKQFERAAYFTGRTVAFEAGNLASLLRQEVRTLQ